MFSVIDEFNEQIGIAYPIPSGYEIKIFNYKSKFILKKKRNGNEFYAFVRVYKDYFINYGCATLDTSTKSKIKFYIGKGQHAFIDFNNTELNLINL